MNILTEQSLEAFSIGPGVPSGSFPVAIHSIFKTAINLQPCNGGNLIMILGHEHSDHPQGVRLTSTEDFTQLGLEPNDKGNFHENGITLERANGGGDLRIPIAKAERYKMAPLPYIPSLNASWGGSVFLLGRLQAQAGTDLNIKNLVDLDVAQGILGKRLAHAVIELGESVRKRNPTSARSAVSKLVGLGSGLTPSGDDFLCGFLSAARCRLGNPSEHTFLRELIHVVLDSLPSTNAISATLLRCAAQGKVSKALQDFAEAIQAEGPTESAIINLCALGHSSGMDIATGFLYGLVVWDKELV